MAKRSYNFTDIGIHIDAMGKEALKRWNDIKKIKNTGNILLIFTGPKLAYVIPRRCFETRYEWRKFIKFLFDRIKGKNKTRP